MAFQNQALIQSREAVWSCNFDSGYDERPGQSAGTLFGFQSRVRLADQAHGCEYDPRASLRPPREIGRKWLILRR